MNTASPPVLKAVLITLVVACSLLAATAIQQVLSGAYLSLQLATLLWVPLAWGLWHLHPLARKMAVAFLWLVVIVLPIDLINPFAAMDGLVTAELMRVAVPVCGLVAAALFCLYILGKYKAEFRHDD